VKFFGNVVLAHLRHSIELQPIFNLSPILRPLLVKISCQIGSVLDKFTLGQLIPKVLDRIKIVQKNYLHIGRMLGWDALGKSVFLRQNNLVD
jgi:hypothetical protein